MKLSRRGKRTKHARRGKHTKRVRKHHTRRIKHRGKQYKRTYRKNNRKLKHNKRIQRGGWEWVINGKKLVANGVLLKYKKTIQTFGSGETNPFNITLESITGDSVGLSKNYDIPQELMSKVRDVDISKTFIGRFKVTMERLNNKGMIEKTFVVYFALYVIEYRIGEKQVEKKYNVIIYSSDIEFSIKRNIASYESTNIHPCYGLWVTDDKNVLYNFSCTVVDNEKFFKSLIEKMTVFETEIAAAPISAAPALAAADDDTAAAAASVIDANAATTTP